MAADLFGQLKERRVFRTAAMYIVVGWLILQVADIVVPALRLPDWTITLLLVLLALFFPLALVLAWVFELTPEGLQRQSKLDAAGVVASPSRSRIFDRALIALLAVAVGLLLVERGIQQQDDEPVVTDAPTDTVRGAAEGQSSPGLVPDAARAEVMPDSIAVMPFDNLSGDSEQEFFSDGMTHDLITDLSKVPGLFVLASSTVFTYKDRVVAPQQVAEELGVRYVLLGSVRRAGSSIRINAQLVEATSGRQLWAERYDGVMTDVFALQDEVARQIIGSLAPQLTPDEVDEIKRVAETTPEAYDELLRGLAHLRRWTPEEVPLARDYFLSALSIDPGYARAYANVALTYAVPLEYGWSVSVEQDSANARKYATKALELNPDLSMVYGSLAMTYINLGDLDAALGSINKALEIDPNYADGYTVGAHISAYMGDTDKARSMIDRAMTLNPRYSFNEVLVLGNIAFIEGRYADAVVHYREVLKRNPRMPMARKWLAATYAQMGRSEDAAWEVEETLMIMPELTVSTEERIIPIRQQEHFDRYIEGLRLAGFPED
ncbi:MAG: tetratricopeptide repeat protein [Chromatiales bacterium]|nr:tetratricopeptide repeat protein [Chromatiales bacterium]